jgi:hypothetical protein
MVTCGRSTIAKGKHEGQYSDPKRRALPSIHNLKHNFMSQLPFTITCSAGLRTNATVMLHESYVAKVTQNHCSPHHTLPPPSFMTSAFSRYHLFS